MRFTIKGQLTFSYLAILVVITAIAIQAIIALDSLDAGLTQLAEKRAPALITLGQLNNDTAELRDAQSRLLLGPSANRAAALVDLADAQKRIAAGMEKYPPTMVDVGDRDLWKKFGELWLVSEKIWNEAHSKFEAGEIQGARTLFSGASKAAYDAAGEAIQQAVDDLAMNVRDEINESHANVARDRAITLAGVAVALAATAGGLLVAFLGVARPVRGLVTAMGRLAQGDSRSPIPFVRRRDEVGDMARSVLVFQTTAQDNDRLAEEAMRNRSALERQREDNEAAQRAAIDQERAIVAASVGAALARLAARDLTHRIDANLPAAYAQLKADFNEAAARLSEALAAVATSSAKIHAEANDLSEAAANLSSSAEQQATNIEETSGSLAVITGNVRKTSDHAAQARELVRKARQGAEKSGGVVEDAVSAMNDIQASSEQMGQIIGVIDEIAFQTNLLALNAGVEAARAGDAGRGFAVVASEVRALAQRSAGAAKEIKALISASGAQVARGVELVGHTGRTLQQIVGEVTEIDGLVAEIAASAGEQSASLMGVSGSVGEIEGATQENAAKSKQSRAACQSLFDETEDLAGIVGSFRLGAGDAKSRLAA